jgi:hypothetical protein
MLLVFYPIYNDLTKVQLYAKKLTRSSKGKATSNKHLIVSLVQNLDKCYQRCKIEGATFFHNRFNILMV